MLFGSVTVRVAGGVWCVGGTSDKRYFWYTVGFWNNHGVWAGLLGSVWVWLFGLLGSAVARWCDGCVWWGVVIVTV